MADGPRISVTNSCFCAGTDAAVDSVSFRSALAKEVTVMIRPKFGGEWRNWGIQPPS